MNTAVQAIFTVIAVTVLRAVALGQAAEPESWSVCIAPVFEKPDGMSAPGLSCESKKLSVSFDNQQAMPFPLISEHDGKYQIGKSVKIDALDTATRHRVVVYCHGKPQQSFTYQLCRLLAEPAMPIPQRPVQDGAIMGGETVSLVQVQVRPARARFSHQPPSDAHGSLSGPACQSRH